MAYSHCTGQGTGLVPGTELEQEETMGPGPCPYLRQVQTFLRDILKPIDPFSFPCPCISPILMQYE